MNDIMTLIFDHVPPPPDATEVDAWLRDDTAVDDETRGFSRGFLGTERTTSRGLTITISGWQWPDGTCHREMVFGDTAVGGGVTVADGAEFAVLLAEAMQEIDRLA